ncbi:MAG: hypothetical protein A2Z21_04170 [Candidatus Fraserbacteria bacterium RBG_16_55_9]|uniref:SLH domain-containing protein n=1 Tax=Fraserbacteria sp. (strain RBG_16_55_9) TaxID=1817864 RepID=A0A1F5UNZ4_FRAXR|nr:MAG: hypothetical protein A2Z21_04170 [Candidatus Fraserbacteria bacterium RBG_16_55_9]
MRGLVTRWTLLVFVLLLTGASALTRADGPVVSSPGVFTDVPASHWAAENLKYLLDRGVIQGLPNGQFQGDRSPSRYEVATLLSRALHYVEKDGPISQQIAPDDLKVLQDLIFKISDRLQQIGSEVDGMKNTNPQMDPDLAERIKNLETQSKEIQDLRTQVQQDQQTIRDLKNQVTQFQIKASTTSEEAVTQMNQQILANRIIGIAALLFAVVGIALATLR